MAKRVVSLTRPRRTARQRWLAMSRWMLPGMALFVGLWMLFYESPIDSLSFFDEEEKESLEVAPNEQEEACPEVQDLEPVPRYDDDTDTWLAPFWFAAYPGSGSSLLLEIVHALTGNTLKGQDIYGGWCVAPPGKAVTCKTHWPVLTHHAVHKAIQKLQFQNTAFVLVRHPAAALPSFFNWWYEFQNKVPSHTTQAPEAAWRTWRDERFESEIGKWKQLLTEWYTALPYSIQLLPYEQVTNESRGPAGMQTVAAAMRLTGTIPVVGSESTDPFLMRCVWNQVVREKATKKRSRAYEPGFRQDQIEAMKAMLVQAQTELAAFSDVVEILEEYQQGMQNIRVDDE